MKSFPALAFVVVFALAGSLASAQSGLGKGKREQGKQEQGKQEQGRSQGGSSSGGLGKSQGGGTSGGSSSGRGQGGGSGSGGGSSSGGGLGKGRDQGGGSSSGGSSSGGYGRSQGGGSSSSGGGLGRSQGGGSSSGGNSRSQGDGGLGRVNDERLNRTNSIGKGSDQGRSGASGYGSNNNRGRGDGTFRIESPQLNLNKGSLSSQVFRSETVRVNSRWRDGYYGYNDNWRDDNFFYPHYVFSPWGQNRDCTVSPWYYYPSLPGYIWSSRIHYYSNTSCDWGIGTIYQWNRRNDNYGWNSYDRRDSGLDEALDDIVNLFERGDRRALNRLVPRRGRVNIYMDSQYCYSLDADDFYDLLLDNVQSTRTSRYSIDRVTTYRDTAQVSASHEYTDPWGRRQCVYHNYRLESDRYGYVITDFLTSGRR